MTADLYIISRHAYVAGVWTLQRQSAVRHAPSPQRIGWAVYEALVTGVAVAPSFQNRTERYRVLNIIYKDSPAVLRDVAFENC